MEKNYIAFRVEDTRIGTMKEPFKQLFGPLVQLKTFVPATGLGLLTSKSMTERRKGKVGADSEPGKGSYFWLRCLSFVHGKTGEFPENRLFESEARSEPTAESDSVSQSQKAEEREETRRKKILVAEDNDSNALLIAAALRHEYDIIRATNGLEALEQYHSQHPDLILMDIKMPDMDGFEATRIIRQTDKDIPIIAVTAFAFDSDRERLLEIGCTEYLAKPIIPGNLRKIIKQYI